MVAPIGSRQASTAEEQIQEQIEWAVATVAEARYAIAGMYALQLFEWVSRLDKEIRLVHRARWSSVKVAYLLCRYYPLLLWPVIMWGYMLDHSHNECRLAGRPLHILLAPFQFFSQAVMFMRAFAFSGRDLRVLIALGLCYAGLLAVDLWAFCVHIEMPPPIFYALIGSGSGCFPNYGSGVMALRIGFSMLAAVLMDLLSLCTVLVWASKESSCRGGSLARYFMKQGLCGFVIVTFVNVGAAVAFFKPPSYHTGSGLPLILVIPNLVACRIILQLRRKVNPTDTEIDRQHSALINSALEKRRDVWLMDSDPELEIEDAVEDADVPDVDASDDSDSSPSKLSIARTPPTSRSSPLSSIPSPISLPPV